MKNTLFIMENYEHNQNIVQNVAEYVNLKKELALLSLSEKVSEVISRMAVLIFTMVFSAIILLFLSFGLANSINTFLNSTSSGYYIVAFIYLLLGGLMYVYGQTFLRQFWIDHILSALNDSDDEK